MPFSHVLSNQPTEQKHLYETMPGGVAVLDYDGDGKWDVFFTNGSQSSRLYRNLGDRKFEDVTRDSGLESPGYTMGAAAADYDGDGRTDLFVTGLRENWLFRNRGGGKFERVPFPATGWSVSAGWFDYDRDGDLDLFVVNYVRFDAATEPYCGDRAAGYRTYCHPRHYQGLANALFRNDGKGRFTDVSKVSGIAAHVGKGMALAIADIDRDGWLDVVVTNDAVPNFLFRNNHDGTFTERAMAAGIGLNEDGRALSSMGADLRDVNGDGQPDLFITALINETFPLFAGRPKGLFEDVTYGAKIGVATMPYSGWSTGIYDFDNDGRKDIFAAAGDVNDNTEVYSGRKSRQQNLLLWNRGDGTFRAEAIGEPARHRGAAFADLDGDGAIDIVVSRLGEAPVLWWNDRARGRHWLVVDAPMGSEVRVAGQTNHATQAVGYASSSAPLVHFGLGTATEVGAIEVKLPDGIVKTFTPPGIDRVVKVP